MKNEKKEFYTIEDIKKILAENYEVKVYRKLADAYPVNKEEWLEDYDDVLTYTDGVINTDDYFLFVTQKKETGCETDGYNEIFLMSSRGNNIPDRMFAVESWQDSGKCVSDMIHENIKYLISAGEKI